MLQFNPYFRLTIDQALAHPFFEKIRKPEKEVEASSKVTVEFDQSGEKLTRERLRELFLEEVKYFQGLKG